MKRLAHVITVIILMAVCRLLHASPQVPDYLIFKGDTIPTYDLLLEEYLQANVESEGGELFGLSFRKGSTLNCWRGYQAIYKIENDSLFLNDIIWCGELNSSRPIDKGQSIARMKDIFKDDLKNDKVFIDWYSGNFSIPNGKPLRWDGVFYWTFESEILIRVKKGMITDIEGISNYVDFSDGIDRRYGDTVSNAIFNELKSIKWKKKYDCSDQYLITIGPKGKVIDVSMPEYQTEEEINEYWDKPEYNYCIRSIKSKLKKMKFDILKDKGIPIKELIFIEIWIERDGTIENWTE